MLFRREQPVKPRTLQHEINLPAKMWRDYIRNVNVVDATQEGGPNDHQYKHESIKRERERE